MPAASEEESVMDHETEPEETIMELRKLLERYWLETLDAYSELELFEIISMSKKEVKESLMKVTTEYSKESQEPIDKLRRVESLVNSGIELE